MQYPNTPDGDFDRLIHTTEQAKKVTAPEPYAKSVTMMLALAEGKNPKKMSWALNYAQAHVDRAKSCTPARNAARLRYQIEESSFTFNMTDINPAVAKLASSYKTELGSILGPTIRQVDPIEIQMMQLGHVSAAVVLQKMAVPKVRDEVMRILTRPAPKLEDDRTELHELGMEAATTMTEDCLRTLFKNMKTMEGHPIALDDESKENYESFMQNVMLYAVTSNKLLDRLPLSTQMRMRTLKQDVPEFAKQSDGAEMRVANTIFTIFQKIMGRVPTAKDIDACLFHLVGFRRLIDVITKYDSFPHLWTP